MTTPAPSGAPPGQVGPYRLVRELGRGGWGVVLEGVAPDGVAVAIKRLQPRALLMHPESIERLRREVSAARLVEHPGVVRALDAGTADGAPYVVYELVRGARPITDAFVERGLRERVALVRDAAAALGAAHARGVVHRDVSRKNVLVDEAGRVRVTDFGLAWLPGQSPLTATGVVLGTPGAIAPEAALDGSKASTAPAVDVWGLGLLLFEALTGVAPLVSDPAAAPPGPRDVDDQVPAPLDAVCRRALAVDPAQRFATGDALAAALDAALRAAVHTPGPPPSARLPVRGARPGARLGRYHLLAQIGAGGMGTVFRARDEELGRDVALKVIDASVSSDRRARFVREQEAAARVRHPNIVAVHEAGETGGLSWLAMDLVEGDSLEAVLRRGPLEPSAAVHLVAACARAVEALHAAGILHRDIKPANVLLDAGGAPRLTDFGVARLADADRLTRTGQGLGTPLYMAPQQLAGEPADERADVYGLGALLYEAAVGSLPWDATTLVALMYAKADAPPAPSTLRPGLAPGLDAVCRRALAPHPSERHASAGELAAELEALLAGGGERSPVVATRRRAWRLVAALVLVWALVGAAALFRRRHDAAAAGSALTAARAELEARARSARSLASLELDREALRDLAADAETKPDAAVLRAWLGLVDLARGDEAAARSALATLAGPALDEPPARALRGGLAARAGDPAAAVADLEAARRAGARHVEVEAWLLHALARRGLDRADAAAWLERIPGLRAPGDARAAPADLLEVACLIGLERRLEAERTLARLTDPPVELGWDLAVLTASDRVAERAPRALMEARELLTTTARPAGPPRPREVALGRRVVAAIQHVIGAHQAPGGALAAAATQQLIALLELKAASAPDLASPEALVVPLIGLVQRTLLLGHDDANPPLLLGLAEAWPDDAAVQEAAIIGLFQDRFGEGQYLVARDRRTEERLAAAAERACSRRDLSLELRFMAHLVRAAALCNLGVLDRAAAASTALQEALDALRAERPARAAELSFAALVVRARVAALGGDLDATLGLLERAGEGRQYDPAATLLVRYEALLAVGRDDEALRLLVELAPDPPRVAGVALTRLAQFGWEHLTRVGRWAEVRQLYERTYDLVQGTEAPHRLAWLRARDGDLAGAADLIEATALRYGGPLSTAGPAVRRGDPAALRLLEREATLPLRY